MIIELFLAPWCSDWYLSDPGSVPFSKCWEIAMVEWPDDGLFLEYGFELFVGQLSYENNSSSLYHNLHLKSCFTC